MLLKSHVYKPSLLAHLQTSLRGMCSKIQNHVVNIYAGDYATRLSTELQPIHKKDGRTIAWSLILIAERALTAIRKGIDQMQNGYKTGQIMHIVTGDGTDTIQNSCRQVFQYFTERGAALRIW